MLRGYYYEFDFFSCFNFIRYQKDDSYKTFWGASIGLGITALIIIAIVDQFYARYEKIVSEDIVIDPHRSELSFFLSHYLQIGMYFEGFDFQTAQ